MLWLYRIIFLPALLIALPYYLARMWRRGGYRHGFSHRFGFVPRLARQRPDGLRIWLQAVSVGEVRAVGPLIDALRESSGVRVLLTTTTSTGYAEARRRYADTVDALGVFPLDFWPCVRLAWHRVRPHCVLLMESELWPEHLHQACRAGCPAFLINARLSDKSYRRYGRFPAIAARMLAPLWRVQAASEPDRRRFAELGVAEARFLQSGNLKCDVPLPSPPDPKARAQLREELGFGEDNGGPVFVLLGASTWPGEETTLLDVRDHVAAAGHDCRLLLVPRHAERGEAIERLLRERGVTWRRRSVRAEGTGAVTVHLADTTGELAELSRAADIAFVGKSLPPNRGGQTPIECAGVGMPVLFGPEMSNFRAVARALEDEGAVRKVADATELRYAVTELAGDPEKRRTMAEAGVRWHRRNHGSSRRTARAILETFDR